MASGIRPECAVRLAIQERQVSYRRTTDEIDEAIHRDFETLNIPLGILMMLGVWGFAFWLMTQ